MKRLLLLMLLLLNGCRFLVQQDDVAPSVTFNKMYAGGVVACGSLYTLLGASYSGGLLTADETRRVKADIDAAKAALDRARALQAEGVADAAQSTLLSAMSAIQAIRDNREYQAMNILAVVGSLKAMLEVIESVTGQVHSFVGLLADATSEGRDITDEELALVNERTNAARVLLEELLGK